MAQSAEFIYISGQGEDLRQPKDWHTVAQVNKIVKGDLVLKQNILVNDALPSKEWERHKDIPHRFDEIKQRDNWVEVKEVVKTKRDADAELQPYKHKPPTVSEDGVFKESISQRDSAPIRKQNRSVVSMLSLYQSVSGNISESSSMDSVTNGMVAFGLGKASSNIDQNKLNRNKNTKKQEINFKGKIKEHQDNHKSYPKERHPKSLFIPPPDYTDDEAQELRSPSQKYYYEKLLLDGIPDTIPRPKLFHKHDIFMNKKYNETETFYINEYGDSYGDHFEYLESEYIQKYENGVNIEYLDHDREYGGKEGYYDSKYHPYYESQYQENIEEGYPFNET